MSVEQPPKVIFFDVFGTVVSWRHNVANALREATAHALQNVHTNTNPEARSRATAMTSTDWQHFADKWHKSYLVFTREYDPSSTLTTGFISVDQHYHDSLKLLLRDYQLDSLFTQDEIHDLSLCWHRLDPWSDSVRGLQALNNQGFRTCTLSNGNMALLEDLNRFGSLPFTDTVSAELFGAYKPSPTVYRGAAKRFGLETGECALVAAHLGDLKAAREQGFQTVYVEREGEEEYSAEEVEEMKRSGMVDMWVGKEQDGFLEVARRFGSRKE